MITPPAHPETETGPISLVILGSTGSIGTQALNVVRAHPEKFEVVALAAGGANLDLLAAQIEEHRPELVAIGNETAAGLNFPEWRDRFPDVTFSAGPAAVEEVAAAFPNATVLNGITGGIGLGPTLAALEAGATVALANKESLVVGGPLVRAAMVRPGQIVPVDSEHSAIAQALLTGVHHRGLVSPNVDGESELAEIVLTASGGPFRGFAVKDLAAVTPAEALAHPTWDMGPVVTINSSTLMNKGLELIEAAILFDVPAAQIVPTVHPQSIVHSLVTWEDGSSIAQAAPPNMEVPIALGLDWPRHLPRIGTPLSFAEAQTWEFFPIDHEVFPALRLAQEALEASATHPAVLNAANEVAVDAFLSGELPWLSIVPVVSAALAAHSGGEVSGRAEIEEIQDWARAHAAQSIRTGRH